MFDTDLYQQVLGLTAPWKVTDVRLDVEATEIHVQVEHPEGCRWNCPHCSRELACYDHAPERQWRHLNTCQFHTLVHARVPRVECPKHGVVQVKVPWAEPHGRFTLLMERFVIDVLQACQTVKGACTLVGITWDRPGTSLNEPSPAASPASRPPRLPASASTRRRSAKATDT